MNKKLLKMFADYIRDNVAYFDNRKLVADVVLQVAKQSGMKLTEKQIVEFEKSARW